MRAWLNSIAQWWNDWVGDKEMENSIRHHLDQSGYYGALAQITNVRLVAIQRPGWLQIYRFEVKARVRIDAEETDGPDPAPQHAQLLGLVRQDFRKSINDIRLFDQPQARRELFRDWAEGLIQLRGAEGLG
ncbi:hypothetical protein [Bremerella sp. P1]|uniref:hypothetical protein n=1 Tax=Bremerella sp. P1 TaxID=3026424 RepID=UPI002367F459|nr:hypothetical protein [Bremerella sp. P1]WDI40857.1 hypothetical protein PSR63_20525 [Bremerella sp. P1]